MCGCRVPGGRVLGGAAGLLRWGMEVPVWRRASFPSPGGSGVTRGKLSTRFTVTGDIKFYVLV